MNLKKAMSKKLKQDEEINGITYFEGMKLVAGVSCPKCGTFYPTATRLSKCNTKGCGYVSKRLKNWEQRKKAKRMKRGELNE